MRYMIIQVGFCVAFEGLRVNYASFVISFKTIIKSP